VIGAAPFLGAEWAMRAFILALIFAASVLAAPALADPPGLASATGTLLSPQDFEAYSIGKTLAYAEDGVIWGRETYLPGRHVLWRAVGEDCKAGHWWDNGGAVCFSYDDGTTAQCGAFATGPIGLTATFLNEPNARPAIVQEEAHPVPCPGPEIGS
jgi:hypothetical protein